MNGITDVLTLSPEGLDWQKLRLCDEADPELFFPENDRELVQIQEAKAVCKPCPVQAECLTKALEVNASGIWAGTTEDERRAMKRRISRTVARHSFAVE